MRLLILCCYVCESFSSSWRRCSHVQEGSLLIQRNTSRNFQFHVVQTFHKMLDVLIKQNKSKLCFAIISALIVDEKHYVYNISIAIN